MTCACVIWRASCTDPWTRVLTVSVACAYSPLARALYSSLDTPLLKPQLDDNKRIEPEWYLPIMPMVLVNGADGIGTGWMTKIPNYNPREIVDNLRLMLGGDEPKPMVSRLCQCGVAWIHEGRASSAIGVSVM